MEKNCLNCDYWKPYYVPTLGRCHNRPPVRMPVRRFNDLGAEAPTMETLWPETEPDDFCGAWKRETTSPYDGPRLETREGGQ